MGRERKLRSATKRNEYIQEDYLAPRVRNASRRYRPAVPDLGTLNEEEGEGERAQNSEVKELISLPDPDLLRGNYIVQLRDCSSDEDGDDESSSESCASLRGNNTATTWRHGLPCDGVVTIDSSDEGSSDDERSSASLKSGTSSSSSVASVHARDGTSSSSNSLESSIEGGSMENCASLRSGTSGNGHVASASPKALDDDSSASPRHDNSPGSVASRCGSEHWSTSEEEEGGGVRMLYPVSAAWEWGCGTVKETYTEQQH